MPKRRAMPTDDRIIEAMENDELVGFCRNCGAEQEPIEHDARGAYCEGCGLRTVDGAMTLLLGRGIGA